MKKLLILLFSFLISFNSYGEWVLMGTDSKGSTWYVDYKKTSESNGYKNYWFLIDFDKPDDGLLSIKVNSEVDCNGNRQRNTSISGYKGNMGLGKEDGPEVALSEWIIPVNIYKILFDYVCSIEPADFNAGAKRWWYNQNDKDSGWSIYLSDFELPNDYQTYALLNTYFDYMVFRDWNKRDASLVSNNEFNNFKDYTVGIQSYYQNNSKFSTDKIWDVATSLFDWKYDFFGNLNSNDYGTVRRYLEKSNTKVYQFAIDFELIDSPTTKDI